MFIHDLFSNNGSNGTADDETDNDLFYDAVLLLFLLTTKWPHSRSILARKNPLDKPKNLKISHISTLISHI